jgi:TonB-linked SusC/RagA family outer membrane protein
MNFSAFFKTVPRIQFKSSQFLLVMKLFVILLFTGLMQVHASVYSQKITLRQKNVSIETVLKAIEKQSDYLFLYDNLELQSAAKISVDINQGSIEQVMDLCLKNQPLTYKVFEKNIVLKRSVTVAEKAIFNPIKGKVLDESGLPIIGASVLIKGTKTGAVTDSNGNFNLNAPQGATLVISFIGYGAKELVVGTDQQYTITLKPEENKLTEVVVTALGIKRSEKSLGYAVQKVSGKELQSVKGVDLGTSLTGRVAGLVVKNSTEFNGKPVLELRGEEAILVVDGVDYGNLTLRDIPADDIESIDILKGPTASALYGAKAKGGVYLITTKKGAAGKGFSIDVNSNTMFQLGYLAIPKVQSSYGRGDNGKLNNDYVWGPRLDAGNTARDWNPVTKQFEDNMPLRSVGKDNLKNFTNTGIIANNNITIAQTGENGSFKIGLNHIYNKGQFPNQSLNMINFTSGGEIKINDKFKIESHFGLSRRTAPQVWGGGYQNQGYLYQLVMWTGAEYDIRDYKDYWKEPNQTQNWMYTNWYDNPYLIAYEKLDAIQENTVNASINANYKLTPDLNLMLRLGYDNYSNRETMRNPTANIFSTRGGWDAKGMYSIENKKGYSTSNDLILSYNKKVNKFSFESLAGGNFFHKQTEGLKAVTKNGLISPTYFSLNGSIEPPKLTPDYYAKESGSLYARAAAGWNDAIFLDFTGRNDWISTQPKSTNSYFYPSVGSSVVISQLAKLPEVIDMFKIRGSFAVFKTPADVYEINNVYKTTSAAWGNLNAASYPYKLSGASDILPSSQRTWEIGAAGYLFKRRLHFDVAYFNKYYYNQQINTKLAASSGFATSLVNTKETFTRRGFEITIDGSILKTKNFEWYSTVNWSQQHRYYDQLDPVYSSDELYVKKGERLDTYMRNYWLTDPSGNLINSNGIPVSSENFKKKYGYGEPDFSFGFINNFTYKNWMLGVNIDGRIGGLMYNYIYDKMWDSGTNPDSDNQYRYDQVVNGLNNYVGKGVKVISGKATYDKYGNITSDTRQYAPNDVQVGYQDYAQNYRGGNMGVQNESFIKLREISLGYKIPAAFTAKLGVKTASMSLTGQNLFMWTNFKYSDPDLDKEDLNSPSMRMIGFNLRVGF